MYSGKDVKLVPHRTLAGWRNIQITPQEKINITPTSSNKNSERRSILSLK